MHRHTYSDAGDMTSPRSRAASFTSFSSERPASTTIQMPSCVRPPPAYIAASVASQIVTDAHNAQLREELGDQDDDDSDAGPVNALFSEPALYLLNAFLDHLVFAFLATAKSPSLTAIRPAIVDVLKQRLAREAMATADEELQGLLAGDEEEFPALEGKRAEKWDVERVWKRTRLRIMVYTRLGELEDEDEERYVQQERGLSMDESTDEEAGLVSWASAIFLTSIIEHVAEQTLLVSGQAAFTRLAAKMKKMAEIAENGEEEPIERVVVEDFDVEKVALNPLLGRIWRTWRKRVRAPITPLSPSARTPRYMSSFTSLHRRRVSHDTADETLLNGEVPEMPEHKPTETDIAANIPLPISDNDVAEIEVPGLAREFDGDDEIAGSGQQTPVPRPLRPSSFIMLSPAENFRRRIAKERPLSMPPMATLPFTVPTQASQQDADDLPFVTSMERMPDDESYFAEHSQEDKHDDEHEDAVEHEILPQKDESDVEEEKNDEEHDADMVAFAASTGMGFGMGPSPINTKQSNAEKEKEGDTTITPTRSGYEAEPQVLNSKRMSFERSAPPQIVRTYSSRSVRSSIHTQPTEGRSYLDDAHSDEELNGSEIGVAHTSNTPIAVPSPPVEKATNDGPSAQNGKPPFEQTPLRNLVHAAPAARKTPSPEARSAPPDYSLKRKDSSPPKARTPALESLQETESWPGTPEKQGSASARGSPRHSVSTRSRESPVAKRKSGESPSHPRAGVADGPAIEKATVQRVSSSSSRSASTSILYNTARESDSSMGRPRGLSGRMSEEDRERQFDSLVKGEETVKFTLTPQSMRDIDEPPVIMKVESPPRPKTAVTVYPPVSADKDNSFGSVPLPARNGSRSKGTVTSPNRTTPSKKIIGPKPLAREPRIQGESMRDFADFIRSTGPTTSEERPVQPFVSLSPGPHSRSPSGTSTPVSGLGRKISTRQFFSDRQSSAGEGPSARPRIQMEPRSPSGQRGGNTELIDFIRQGPPNANSGQHRIPRSVAPFRTTVDSDQFDRMLDENNSNIESGFGSQVSTASTKHSTNTSNSRTGLLATPNTVQPAYSNTPQKLSGSLSNPEPHITRTRRRVKDPYAIDSDDEDDDEDLITALPKSAPPRREEGLMDFLNSMEPPSNNNPQPLLLDPAVVAAAKARVAAMNSSAASIPSSTTSSATARNGSSVRNNGPTSPPSQAPPSIRPEARGAMQQQKPRLQARGALARESTPGRSDTNDLADFFRTSGPPEPPAPAPGATIKKEEGRKSTRFWRKKTSDY
ncbi:hypothetical protein P154DRAFT_79976 [Amniculicola lignicola CBS 123094]|uniref:Uncharacterized protein n=1 Tax=Amniculicola lignicola CBS 123094 TaxID=1392246 RepID=A0A6A5WPP2_9PLEO|nr:hypothetical protein P154DRAFT_79976 [Amniculicola lignicola CBS 123094]